MLKNNGKNKDFIENQWGQGQSGNPNGRPKGQRNYATIYREALKKIAESQNMTAEEIEELMVQSGLKKAIRGDYNFYRDTMDRLHGKPLQKTDFTSQGEKVQSGVVILPSREYENSLEATTKTSDSTQDSS